MKNIVCLLYIGLLSALPQVLYPLLDGRITPIVLNTRYTFTNYEYARGFVHFRDGFDVPFGGTVLLQLDGKCPVYNSINLNNGTIIINNELTLASNVRFDASGFIIGEPVGGAQPSIYFETFFTFPSDIYIKVMKNLAFKSNTWGMIDFLTNSILDTSQADIVSFSGCSLIMRGNSIRAPEGSTSKLYFSNCNIFPSAITATEIKTPIVYFQGYNLISVGNQLIMKKICLIDHGDLEIGSSSKLTLSALELQKSGSRFILNNAIIDFTSTSSSPITIGAPLSSEKVSLVINGKNSLTSSTGNSIIISSNLRTEFLPGASLILNKKTHLTIM